MGCKEKLTMHVDFWDMEYKDKAIQTESNADLISYSNNNINGMDCFTYRTFAQLLCV